eukprot:gnl/Trimastix_PCT/3636.p1 GENE.gnl/Trimastix_PCT/3636~~gnl/Trimastix_PCT/3636.p1  ORF type:complete len:441 (-),score=39.62 gnl/Trimastix_PCT/3636:119-1402(-)
MEMKPTLAFLLIIFCACLHTLASATNKGNANALHLKWAKEYDQYFAHSVVGQHPQFVVTGAQPEATDKVVMAIVPVDGNGTFTWTKQFPHNDSKVYQIPNTNRVITVMTSQRSGRHYHTDFQIWEHDVMHSQMHHISTFEQAHCLWKHVGISGDGKYVVMNQFREIVGTPEVRTSTIVFDMEQNRIEREFQDMNCARISHKGFRALLKGPQNWVILDLQTKSLLHQCTSPENQGYPTLSYDYLVAPDQGRFCVYRYMKEKRGYEEWACLPVPQGGYALGYAEISPDQRTLLVDYSLNNGSYWGSWFVLRAYDLTHPRVPFLMWSYTHPSSYIEQLRPFSTWSACNDIFVRGTDHAPRLAGPPDNPSVLAFHRSTGLIGTAQTMGSALNYHLMSNPQVHHGFDLCVVSETGYRESVGCELRVLEITKQ